MILTLLTWAQFFLFLYCLYHIFKSVVRGKNKHLVTWVAASIVLFLIHLS